MKLSTSLQGVTLTLMTLMSSVVYSQTAGRKTPVPIADLPGWSPWAVPIGSDKVEYRWRSFNQKVKPGCGIEWRSREPKAAYTLDAVVGLTGKTGTAPAMGGQEWMGPSTERAAPKQNPAASDIPLHFALFGDGKSVSFYDLRVPAGCDRMEVHVLALESGAR